MLSTRNVNSSVYVYVADIWTPAEIERKYLKSCEMWWWRRMEKISWTDSVKNESITRSQGERNILESKKEGRLTGLL
jgi:hypothetical protein